MNQEKQRIAIAEFCGYTRQSFDSVWWDNPSESEQIYEEDLPDYLNDLNAIREAEQKLLFIENPGKYLDQLVLVVAKSQRFSANCPKKALKYVGVSPIVCADAEQRAEALLRTIGKWEETNET